MVSQRRPRSFEPISKHPPCLVWQSIPPTNGGFLVAMPTTPTIFVILNRWFKWDVLPMPSTPTNCGCPHQPCQVCTRGGGRPRSLFPFLCQLSTLSEAPHLQMSLPQTHRRSCTSLICGGWGIGGTTPGFSPKSCYDCGSIGAWIGSLPGSIFQYVAPTHGWPPVPLDVPPWLPGGPYCGAAPLLGSGSKTQSVDWAVGQMMWPPSNLPLV